jgi:biotin operon repressor/endogenous inhibitor of DNA gyrase (YacG/DUF329 family)
MKVKFISKKGRIYEYIYPREDRKPYEHHPDFVYKPKYIKHPLPKSENRLSVLKIREDNPCATLQTVAVQIGVTRERVRQILKTENKPTFHWRQKYICLNCGREMTRRRIFCSRECRSAYQKILVSCDNCGQLYKKSARRLITSIKRGHEYTFCSKKCTGLYLGSHAKRAHRKYDYNIFLNLYIQGLSHQRIAEQLGVKRRTSEQIIHTLRRQGIIQYFKTTGGVIVNGRAANPQSKRERRINGSILHEV